MSSPNKYNYHTSPEGTFVAERPSEWLSKKNRKPSPSESTSFECPYTLRKTDQIQYDNHLWTIGDIVSLRRSASLKVFYAQIIELFENSLCEKRAKVMWLGPKSNIGVTYKKKLVHHESFKPNDFVHINLDKRLVSLDCLKFIMHVPNQFEYKKHIGTDYLVDTHIISHAERYAESDEDEGPKSKSKVRRLLNK
ncbi:uncharacterized protein LOC112685486 [Sipha flava]|uniref:Uncharacterized protein LOC112685486 n=1 Tax=Sipha flava TaxID=143950 RepID=A0A8B8FS68_9HEMI|nr:uncharacterized protein LOC112685486 [Sipha flava]